VTELNWYDPKDDHPPWIKALAEVGSEHARGLVLSTRPDRDLF